MLGDTEARRFATDRSGVIHIVVALEPEAAAYLAACGVRINARRSEIWRSVDPPGVICAQCRAVPDSTTTTTTT